MKRQPKKIGRYPSYYPQALLTSIGNLGYISVRETCGRSLISLLTAFSLSRAQLVELDKSQMLI